MPLLVGLGSAAVLPDGAPAILDAETGQLVLYPGAGAEARLHGGL